MNTMYEIDCYPGFIKLFYYSLVVKVYTTPRKVFFYYQKSFLRKYGKKTIQMFS